MKYHLVIGTGALLFFYGCFQPQSPNISIPTQKCSTPLAKIHLDSITSEKNDLQIKPELLKTLLEKNLQDHCLILTQTSDADTYEMKITYETSAQSASKENIATSTSQNTIQTQVHLWLKNATTTKSFDGKNSIQIDGKKILSIGQDSQITQEDKKQSITKAFEAAYHSVIKSFQ
ncbi:hypothetical protein [Helicobacter sp. 11S03491-1]|uniref:hypothetical protein n=1 Tax=Helicobacter sp. 11S03491-1 TaxID=1476196 RepID=UPI000BA61C17|nr:hypothetical protein [Helicobacter sp. 11S03491-1]PAF43883.1 hypothetical protein BKH45_01060 [Helicobacter sp. 11S03491-1]